MITELKLMFGATQLSPPLVFAPKAVTVFVGPNNSGKSLVLREIGSTIFTPPTPQPYPYGIAWEGYIPPDRRRIVSGLTLRSLESAEILGRLEKTDTNGMAYLSSLLNFQNTETGYINAAKFLEDFRQNRTQLMPHAQLMVLRSQVEFLDGQRRLNLVDPRPSGSLRKSPMNHLQALFRDDARRRRLADMTKEAFGMYFVIDPTNLIQLQVSMSPSLPNTIEEERSISDKALDFFIKATPISEMGDGVKAYTGILAAILCADLKVIMIDEPDAFLHPPLARRLGCILTTLAFERDGNVFASTHNSNFLMGCIQAGKPVNIIRLTYQEALPTARLLEAQRLREMMRDPLLRSTRVMDALFHQGAIVCEADTDRSFYQEINDRLLGANRQAAIDCIFLNAQNKQTVRRIVRPLRDMGIPAAAIIDLDIIIKKGTNNDLQDLMEAAYVPDALRKGCGQLRGELEAAFKSKNLIPKRDGIKSLEEGHRESAEVLLRDLSEYGIFLTPVGELEKWLTFLGVPSNTSDQKRDWLPLIFDKMGTDPDEVGYLTPDDSDVWVFIQKVAEWIADPSRKGMP